MHDLKNFEIKGGVLVRYKRSSGEVVIPDVVTTIGEKAFANKKITSVVIPESVQEIGAFAFEECIKLETVHLPQSLQMVKRGAFYACRSLKKMIFPEHTQFENIDWTINYSPRLQYVEFPPTAHINRVEGQKLGLAGCSNLAILICPGVKMDDIVSGQKLAAIRGYICHTERFLNEEVNRSYNEYLFKQKKNLLPIIWEQDAVHVLDILAQNGKISAKDVEAEYLESAMLANAVNCVSFLLDWKNKDAAGRKTRRVAKSVLDADPYCAAEMKKIWSTKKLEDGTLEITSYKGTSTEVEVPFRIGKNPVTRIAEQAFSPYRADSLVHQKPYDRFKALKAIRSVAIPEGVASIGKSAFAGCSALEQIHIPETVTQIGDKAFEQCVNLKQIVLPSKVERIGGAMFRKCERLCSVSLPAELKSIGMEAFLGCCSLQEIPLPGELGLVGEDAFAGCNALVGENKLVIIGQTVYHSHTDAQNVVIPDHVTKISRLAFSECKRLENLVIPSSVVQIGLFREPGDIGNFMFSWCRKKLTIYALPDSCGAQYAKSYRIALKHINESTIFTKEE